MAKRVIKETKREYIDPDTGELIVQDTEKVTVVKTTTESFFMTFIDHMSGVLGLKTIADKKLLEKLCGLAEFNTGVINLSTAVREQLCVDVGINKTNFSKHLKRLKDADLIKGEKGQYTINPLVFWKGDLKSRNKALNEGLYFTIKFEK